jgi:hypothetical protein
MEPPHFEVRMELDGWRLFWAHLEGESYESLRAPFRLEGKPVLCDEDGPLDTPITGNIRVKVDPETMSAWLVASMPANQIELDLARATLGELVHGIRVSFDPAV